jgi:hypothetical protein
MKSFKQYILDEGAAFIEKPVTPVNNTVPEPSKVKKKTIKPPVEEPLEPIEIETA